MQTAFENFDQTFEWEDGNNGVCVEYGFNQDNGDMDISQPDSASQSSFEQLDITMRDSTQLRIKLADNGNNMEEQEHEQEQHKGLPFSLLSRKNCNIVVCNMVKVEQTRQRISTNQIMGLAGHGFLKNRALNKCTNDVKALKDLMTANDKLDAELTLHLLTAAEKVSEMEYSIATILLATDCRRLASKTGTPVQRLAYYFVEALEKRIERETTGRKVTCSFEQKLDQEGHNMRSNWRYNSAILSLYQQYPFFQALRFAGVQAILERIEMKSKVHIYDIHMRTGAPWAILMQAVSAKRETHPIQHLKITVIQPAAAGKQNLEMIGLQLQSLAKTIGLFQFSFHSVFVADFVDKRLDMDPEEAIVVYAPFVMSSGVGRPACLEKFMEVIKSMKPTLMVVTEVEANYNTPSLVNRFVEALFTFGAIFDSLEDGMGREDQTRMDLEEGPMSSAIHNIIATEGKERVTRNVKFDVWKYFFIRFGMVGTELSESSIYQASIVAKSMSCGNSCTLEMEINEKNCLIVGWKGTPLFGLSIWRFT